MLKPSFWSGISFGLTSGVITTLGLMVGLEASTSSKLAVVGGILTIAIADAFSDAMGMHVSKEAGGSSSSEVWETTFATFFAKFFCAITFVVPVLFFPVEVAIWVAAGWGMLLLALFSLKIAHDQKESPWHIIGEHVSIALLVIFLAHQVGHLINSYFA